MNGIDLLRVHAENGMLKSAIAELPLIHAVTCMLLQYIAPNLPNAFRFVLTSTWKSTAGVLPVAVAAAG
jgi:hypothetical protein